MKAIAAAFVRAQKAFGPALKTATNPHLKTKYADLSACVEAVIDGLNSAGIALMQHSHECDDGVIVETVFVHESGETMSAGRLHIPAGKKDAQGYGSALTYARRYSLMAACGIAPEDDDGQAAKKKTGVQADVEAALPELSAGDREYYAELAQSIKDALDNDGQAAAYDRMARESLENEQKLYLNGFLGSRERRALKDESAIRHSPKK